MIWIGQHTTKLLWGADDSSLAGRCADLFGYSNVSMVWTKLDTGPSAPCPSPRSGHTMTAVGKDIYILGGTTSEGDA